MVWHGWERDPVADPAASDALAAYEAATEAQLPTVDCYLAAVEAWAPGTSRSIRRIRPRPWENASEVWVDAPCFPGVRADADRQTDASSLSEAIRF